MIRLRLLLLLFVFSLSCDSEEAEFPELITMQAQQIGATSVVLEMEIKETGTVRPIRYGFLWSESSGLNLYTASNKVDLGMTSNKGKYSIRLESLMPNTQYFVRSFAANHDYTKVYYGNESTFTTLN
ncbi:MAG TPA: hypothetical protein PKN99_04190 [Cyclobacteriaceae bacterium]|nr:hypothetical protein [Cyclobacteriaceae bacterium]HNP06797.1 hypothetical protein [Cyclobacteriaceae bacterium]